jgi:hypothetical protein
VGNILYFGQSVHRRTRQGAGEVNCPSPQYFGKPWKFGQTLEKIKKIRADLSENMLKSGYFITILRKNSSKLSTATQKTSAPFSYEGVL